jgi:Carboxypeptidase regulatory-like domain
MRREHFSFEAAMGSKPAWDPNKRFLLHDLRSGGTSQGAFRVKQLLLTALLLTAVAPNAQMLGTITGTITDTSKGVLPGVRVTIAGTSVERSTITNEQGRFEFVELPSDTYTLRMQLAGFETSVQSVVVTDGETSNVAFDLQLGCLDRPLIVLGDWLETVRAATLIGRLRISASETVAERCAQYCSCIEHEADVIEVLKAAPSGVMPATIVFFQMGAGRAPGRRVAASQPYGPGQEFIALLQWNSEEKRFLAYEIFQVENGRVDFRRENAPGLSNNMSVEDFTRALRSSLKEIR